MSCGFQSYFFTGKVNFKDKADLQIAQKRKTYWVPLFIAGAAIVVLVVVLVFVLPVGFFTSTSTIDAMTNKAIDSDETKSPDVRPPVAEEPSSDKDSRDRNNQKPGKK